MKVFFLSDSCVVGQDERGLAVVRELDADDDRARGCKTILVVPRLHGEACCPDS